MCVRWASALPEGLVKQTCSISTLCGVCRVSLHLFPLHLHAHMHQHAFSCTYLHSGTRTRVMWPALESPLSSLCAASHAVTLRHTTHACSSMCVYVLCCSCISAHTLAAWALCGWRKWRTMMGSLVCLVACTRTCVRAPVCLWISDALTHEGKHFLLLYFAVFHLV